MKVFLASIFALFLLAGPANAECALYDHYLSPEGIDYFSCDGGMTWDSYLQAKPSLLDGMPRFGGTNPSAYQMQLKQEELGKILQYAFTFQQKTPPARLDPNERP